MVRSDRRAVLGMAGTVVAGAAAGGATGLLQKGFRADAATTGATRSSLSSPARLTGGVEVLSSGATSPQVTELTAFRDPLRIPPTLTPSCDGVSEIRLIAQRVRLHSQLPPTPMWTFEGYFPGPSIEVRSRQRIRVAWANQLVGTSPVKAVWAPPVGPPPGHDALNLPGSAGTVVRPEITALTPWTTVHVHGGHQFSVYDGMADTGVTPGFAQLAEYLNDNAARHLFYHDHAMPIASVNVFAGLIGNYFIRDPEEDALDLPRGRYEIPLMLGDVNFETDTQGRLTGELLHKRLLLGPYSPEVLPVGTHFLGPYTMVNGVVWPYLDVEARAYRFRLVNGAVGRHFGLLLVDEATGRPVPGAMKVIGTDLGLLGTPKVVDGPLPISPAERVDIVIDFAALAGRRLLFTNTAPGSAPIPYPQVMQFRVAAGESLPSALPTKLAAGFTRIGAADLPETVTERFVALVFDASGMPLLMELREVAAGTPNGRGIVRIALPTGERTFRSVANYFEDTTGFFSTSGCWEKWTFINVDPMRRGLRHPMHIHLLDFQLLERHNVDGSAFDLDLFGTSEPIAILDGVPIGPGESGWKDTVAVPGNSMVTIAGRYGWQSGRFMYHCHILDHEDGGMMRPLVVMPPAVAAVQNITMASRGRPNATPMMPGAAPGPAL